MKIVEKIKNTLEWVKKAIKICFGSKTNIFLLAYILFLFYCLFRYPYLDSSISIRTINAITVASALLSLAELIYSINSMDEEYSRFMYENYGTQLKTIELLQTQMEKDHIYTLAIMTRLIELSRNEEQKLERKKEYCTLEKNYQEEVAKRSADNEIIERIKSERSKIRKRMNKTPYWGNAIMVLGIMAFFILVVDDTVNVIFADKQSMLTILAFILVVLNYFLKELYDAYIKSELKKKKKDADGMISRVQEQIKRNNEEMKEMQLEEELLMKIAEHIQKESE